MEMLTRSMSGQFETRDGENGEKYIEGYFAVFDSPYNIGGKDREFIAPGAFDECLDGDVRALINHDTTLVIGRTVPKTLKLRTDNHGLFGSILINPNDQDAINAHARVQRGDVSQCSFGFEVLSEKTTFREDGGIDFIIEKVRLFEVSICTFPAYEATEVQARSREAAALRHKAWKERMLARI